MSVKYYKKCLSLAPIEKWPASIIQITSGFIINLGYAYFNSNQHNLAINWYKKALDKFTVVGENLVTLYYNLGLYSKNKTLLRKAIHLDNNYISAYKSLAKLYENDMVNSSNKLYIMKQLLRLYNNLLYKDKVNSVLYGIKICKLSRQILKTASSQRLWVLMNVNEYLSPISRSNINTLSTDQIDYIFHFIENCLGFLNSHIITSFKPAKSNVKRLYQYTSINTLKNICNVSKNIAFDEKHPFRLRLYNSEYMNDPSEGKELFKKMANISKDTQHIKFILDSIYHRNKSNSNELHPSHVYISSLSCVRPLTSDSTPMWCQYGDSNKGVALGLDIKLHINSNDNTSGLSANKSLNKSNYNKIPLNLYRVSYDVKDSNNDDTSYLNNIVKYMNKLNNDILKDTHISNLLKFHLDKIRFVFKSSNYKQEKEYRIMEDSPDFSNTKYDKDNEKLYIELDNKNNVSAKLNEIVFGNRCKNYNWLPIVRKQLGDNIIMRKSNENIRK